MYIMRQIKKLTWLQVCFLGDVRVIWCNSLGDSHFQTYVMNFVEIVIGHYLLIISHVSQAILVAHKLSTLYCVWTCCGHPRLKVPWFWCKICFNIWALRTNCLKILFWEDLDWIQGFLKNFSSHSYAFYS